MAKMIRVRRANPTPAAGKKSTPVQRITGVALTSAIVGGTTAAAMLGLKMAGERIPYFVGKPYQLAGAKAAAGIALGSVVAILNPPGAASIGAALGIAGVAAGALDAYATYMAQRALQQHSQTQPQTGAGNNASAQGLPAGYAGGFQGQPAAYAYSGR